MTESTTQCRRIESAGADQLVQSTEDLAAMVLSMLRGSHLRAVDGGPTRRNSLLYDRSGLTNSPYFLVLEPGARTISYFCQERKP